MGDQLQPQVPPYFLPINRYMFRWAGDQVGDDRPVCAVYKSGDTYETTAAISRYEGRRIWTVDGRKYFLGSPEHLYLQWLAYQGYDLDETNPLALPRNDVTIMGPSEDQNNPYYCIFHDAATEGDDPEARERPTSFRDEDFAQPQSADE